MVQLEPDGRVAVGDHLAAEPVHGKDRALVAVEVDEAVARRLPGELVGHHFDGDDPVLPELGHSLPEEGLVHVGLEASDPKCSDASHRKLVGRRDATIKKEKGSKNKMEKIFFFPTLKLELGRHQRLRW